ncbi:hypothetical protein LUZ60_016169 [Juncus effusus]|nr:hypothetical protein LUZ60_016169 [Juncus effusus]
MKFAIGTPPVDVTANFETGSAMTWIQCLPCNPCFGQKDAIFDPSKSTSIINVACDSNACGKAEITTCENATCTYMMHYGDGSTTKGSVHTENFAFPTTSGQIAILDGIVFGCGHQNAGIYIEEQQGFIGFSMSPRSFIGIMGYKQFSYCLPTYSFTDTGSYLFIGQEALLSGGATIIAEEDAPMYYVNLDDITVGNVRLHLEFGYFRRTPK